MKKILLTLFCMFFFCVCYSQDMRLGFTAKEIQLEFRGHGLWSWSYTSQYGGYHILISDNYRWTTYYYFKTKTAPCKLSMLFPKDVKTLNSFIGIYTRNKNTILIDKNYWKIIGSGGERLYLLLDYDDEELPYFMYGYLDENL